MLRIHQQRKALSMIMLLSASFSSIAGQHIPLTNYSNTSAGKVCAIDGNGQDWAKLQKKISQELRYSAIEQQQPKSLLSRLRAATTNALSFGDGIAGRYYIPVVFHVYGEQFTCSDSEESCLTDDKIVNALLRLNEDFQGTNTHDSPIAAQFQAIRENLNIEFVLAKKDPVGQQSTGIVRYNRDQAGYGNGTGSDQLIAADAWDNNKYMNVYIMNDLYDDGSTNNSGVAWYPDSAMTAANTARVVYNGWYVGDNTDENFRSVLTHEFGHWLNLPHTFSGDTCSLANETFCSLTGDRSCDTPQMSLSTDMYENSQNCLGQATNTENFMHYTSNYAMFTQDQVARMTAALHGNARNALWTNENLVAVGLSDLTTDAPHQWDGRSGLDFGPQGEEIATFNNMSANKGDVDTFVIDAPQGTQALAFYLDGYTQDPDMYVSAGQVPALQADGKWQADFISFLSAGQPEFVAILGPKTDKSYHAAVHAFTAYDNATLQVLAVDDPLLEAGQRRFHVIKQAGLWSPKDDAPKRYQFSIPDNAEKVVVVLAGAYGGDPDMYVSRNKPVDTTTADCKPFSAAKLAEYCQFNQGGVFNIMIDPFAEYWDAELHVYYETRDQNNQPPFANIAASYQGIINHQLHFNSGAAVDVDGEITQYHWDFGDGYTSDETNAVHQYQDLGEYSVTLTVTDNDGATSSTTSPVNITLYNPNDEPLCDGCRRVYLAQDVDLSSPEGATPRTYHFSVPNAASLVVIEIVAGSNGDPDLHVGHNVAVSKEVYSCRPWEGPGAMEQCKFTAGGIFNVMIDPFKAYSAVTLKAYYDIRDDADHSLPNELPIANTNGNYQVISGNELTFSSEGSTDADGEIVSYLWRFGDGSTSELEHPIHVYNEVGQYNIGLTVTDNEGATATSTSQVTVIPVGDMDGDGDVDRDDIRAFMRAIRAGQTLDDSFDLNQDGVVNTRDVRLMRGLCSYDRCSNVAPPPQAPVAVASGEGSATQFEAVSFSSDGSSDQYGRIVSYAWNFGDGESSIQPNPSHVFHTTGQFNVVLTVTDNDGMTATNSLTININYGALVNSCAIESVFEEGTLEAGSVACLGDALGRSFAIPDVKNHQTMAITVAHGAGDLSLYYRNGTWPNIANGDYDHSAVESNNQACIYIELDSTLNYWSYIQLQGASAGATIVVDYDTAGCRPVQ
ncbi:MAG: PKD domain-containing protein [Gammaproteobacteria bacterium]|nr:PKD domain-containing protein [Gammaproteobacteria bacterium]